MARKTTLVTMSAGNVIDVDRELAVVKSQMQYALKHDEYVQFKGSEQTILYINPFQVATMEEG